MLCSISGCDRPVYSRSWCRRHYGRWQNWGDPLGGRYRIADPVERFLSFTVIRGGCWLWTGCRFPNGYGQFFLDGRKRLAHRAAYELLVGPIPEGMTLDHVRERGCSHRHCVNPAHLEPVPMRVNNLRGDSPAATNARKTHCKHGHEFTPENTRIRPSGRGCKTCHRDQGRSRYRRLHGLPDPSDVRE